MNLMCHSFVSIVVLSYELVEQSFSSSIHYLNPNSMQRSCSHSAKRSHSCTPFLELDPSHTNDQHQSSARTLLQIRRHSAKISEDLANLTAQLSASMSNTCSLNARVTYVVNDANKTIVNADCHAPTIDQLLAETDAQTIIKNSKRQSS
jgi:hypothetical protein